MGSVSERWNLNKSQAELDFVDIDPEEDMPLYLDPYAFTAREDAWSDQCQDLLASFFFEVIKAIHEKNETRAVQLLSHLNEPEETHLGVSERGNKGRGIGPAQAVKLYRAFSRSKAAKTGLFQDLADVSLFVDQVGRDKISDITTNVLRRPLIEYTQRQCFLHRISMQSVASGFCWDGEAKDWQQSYVRLPVVDGRKIILVPKYAVRFQVGVDFSVYYDKFVLNFLRAEHLRAQDSLVHTLKNQTQKVYKSELRQRYKKSKDFLAEFSEQHPEVIEEYKEHLRNVASRIPRIDSEEFSEADFSAHLIGRLRDIPSGSAGASDYHDLCIGIVSFLFFPYLINPTKEAEINEGRKRIDILYTNSLDGGVFYRLFRHKEYYASYIPVECKNYSKDPKNPEFDQLIARFNRERGRCGILMFRTTRDRKSVLNRCRDAANSGQGCILPMDDEFVIELLSCIHEGNRKKVDVLVDDLVKAVLS